MLGKKCPDLGKRGHGKWYARYEAPSDADGKRRTPMIGPYDTEKECKNALTKVLGRVGQTGRDQDRKMTVGQYLTQRYERRLSQSQAGDGLKPSTLEAERQAIELYLNPGLGHLKLVDLRDHHVHDLYVAMRRINRTDEDDTPTEILRRLLAARADRNGRLYSTRPLTEARIQRVHAVLTGALNDAVKVSKILFVNPAQGVYQTSKSSRKGRIKPLLWTPERVEHWEKTGKIPHKVMVWSPAQCGAFLDFVEQERLYPLWHLAAFWGLRRSELVGLEWQDVSLGRRRLHVRQAQVADELDDVKAEDSARTIVLDEQTMRVLAAWRERQGEERQAWGAAYTESGRVFTYEDGRALRPMYLTQRFDLLIGRHVAYRRRAAEEGWGIAHIARRHRTTEELVKLALYGPPLPPIRFHDLRHGSATMLHAAGVSMKVVSEIMGHASESFTADVYAVVAEELAEEAAAKIGDFVPRRTRDEADPV